MMTFSSIKDEKRVKTSSISIKYFLYYVYLLKRGSMLK